MIQIKESSKTQQQNEQSGEIRDWEKNMKKQFSKDELQRANTHIKYSQYT